MNEDDKPYIGWRNRDWVWLVCILIAIMILMIAGFYNSDTMELNFSIISSAVSIALALVAIFIALKQDSDNQRVNYKVDYKLELIANDLKNVDEKVYNALTTILGNLAGEKADAISPDDLIDKKEQYSQEDMEELFSNYTNQIKDTLNKVVNQNKPIATPDHTVYASDLLIVYDKLLTMYPIGGKVSRNNLLKIVIDLKLRSAPRKLIDRMVRNGFLERSPDYNENKSYIINDIE